MRTLRFFFSPSGRLPQRPFAYGAVAIYLAGAASQWLTAPSILGRAGLAPFAFAQALLIWLWFALHAKRLRDAGRPVGLAAGIGTLYVLSVVLLLIVAAAFFNSSVIVSSDANTTGALGLILLLLVITTLFTLPHYDFAWAVVGILTAVAFVPVVVAVALTLWAASQPGSEEGKS